MKKTSFRSPRYLSSAPFIVAKACGSVGPCSFIHFLLLALTVIGLSALPSKCSAVTFTQDTLISYTNFTYDGQDIAVTNCTLTVDGAHGFLSVHLLSGGILTHSAFSNNVVGTNLIITTGESHVIGVSNFALLNLPNVLTGSVVVADASGSNIYSLGTDYQLGSVNSQTTVILVPGSSIPDGSTILASYTSLGTPVFAGLHLTVTNNVEVESGGGIDVIGRGYGPGFGPGAGTTRLTNFPYSYYAGSGGGHGGFGGASSSQAPGGMAYGSVFNPTNSGSGGGAGAGTGGWGGGVATLSIGGDLRVDGRVVADGANGVNPQSGGGSGGSILLSAHSISGTGSISAKGGSGEPNDGGGAGGGQIAIYWTGDAQPSGSNTFSGIISAQGGGGAYRGGAGTIYSSSQSTNLPAQMLADNGGYNGTNTLLSASGVFDLIIRGGAVVQPGANLTINSLSIASNAWLTWGSNQTQSITITHDAIISPAGGINANGKGFASGTGPGAGHTLLASNVFTGSGGGHGGVGGSSAYGAVGGIAYDTTDQPLSAGSGGGSGSPVNSPGGAGGGIAKITVLGTLTLDGKISADGLAGPSAGSGGGAGGSVWLAVNTINGAGLVSANGGSGELPLGGGGGGGRVLITYTNRQFTGSVFAHGGAGATNGNAGTIYWQGPTNTIPQVVVDNAGAAGPTNTMVSFRTTPASFDLTVQGWATASQASGLLLNQLFIGSNSWFTSAGSEAAFVLRVADSANIQAGGGIRFDGLGNLAASGPGAGRTTSTTQYGTVGSGGGYGGCGGMSAPTNFGGTAYGSAALPTTAGSGGGNGTSPSPVVGGSGGGALQLFVTNALALNGIISANGNRGIGQGSGGGSGGGIFLSVGIISGTGLISANGGDADLPYGGGGGGGRIALRYTSNLFVGTFTARGGAGYGYGGAGTIFLQDQNQNNPRLQLTIDNGGKSGTNTPLPTLEAYDLTVSGGGIAVADPKITPVALKNLLITSNSFLVCTSLQQTTFNATNVTVQAGGGILADGGGYASGLGTGPGRNGIGPIGNVGSGAGHGGAGGAAGTAAGGTSYDSLTAPVAPGSGGGSVTFPFGGAGGGAIRLNVTTTLALDGKISANGLTGPGLGTGGGSGGSLYLSVGKIMGSGSISANGGAGDLPYGGGGGGGRIALYYITNQFTGPISAAGGAGSGVGGAGTVYLKSNFSQTSQITVNNAGLRSGTNTLLTIMVDNPDITVQGGATAAISTSSMRSLLVASNSAVILTNISLSGSAITVSSNLTVQKGAFLTADGLGYQGGGGPGAGHTQNSQSGSTGSGAGYGGYGGASTLGALGGNSYGSSSVPTDLGSGGGNTTGTSPYNLGGAGGGAIRLTVNGTLRVDGRLSADGLAAVGPASGGGAGGSLLLTTVTLAGTGTISASGGAGDPPYGGGGGGGRITIYFDTNLFTGGIFAQGGIGAMAGGAGTLYLNSTKPRVPQQLIVDNGGLSGTNTPLAASGEIALTIKGGAVVSTIALASLNTLTIASNSWLTYSNGAHALLTVTTSNATILGGGGISLNGAGFAAGAGPGAGGSASDQMYGASAGGGGHGGFGAGGIGGAKGGNAYGSLFQPVTFGSGGGGSNNVLLGGAGGGALQLTVSGRLQVDGTITANGRNSVLEGGGGGSGGSLWLTVGTLAGTGAISAIGGDGDYGQGGGGAGGRIAVSYSTNLFQGPVIAWGGMGATVGGAGTIYYKPKNGTGRVIVDNDGWEGTNTPIATLAPFDLTVSGSAIVNPDSGPLVLNNLLVQSGGMLTHLDTQSNLDITILTNATIAADGAIGVSGLGYSGPNGGPGAGQMTNSFSGSGAGYGGPGGAGISGIAGGGTYGSATQPTDRGSRGGVYPVITGFCQGGGAVRLQVGGTLAIDGLITASGNAALLEGGGGGAGGSVWLTARKFGGTGMIFANGGPGEPDEGGGGGGGRIAIYSLSNSFTGIIGAYGGDGASPGGDGSVYVVTNIPVPQVIAQTPSGVVESSVDSVDLTFGSPMDFSSASSADFSLDTPNGPLAPGSLSPSAISLTKLHVSFPSQNELGYYEIAAGPAISDIYGQSMAVPYFGSFAIVPPLISGRVVDTNGQGVPFLTIQVSSNAFPILTDINGYYSLEVFPDWSGSITPERGGRIFIPPSRAYANVSNDMTNQNFVMTTTSALALSSKAQGTNFSLSWFGINGVSYQVMWSSNLVNWVPYNPPIIGTNGPAGMAIPMDVASPSDFFRFRAGY